MRKTTPIYGSALTILKVDPRTRKNLYHTPKRALADGLLIPLALKYTPKHL